MVCQSGIAGSLALCQVAQSVFQCSWGSSVLLGINCYSALAPERWLNPVYKKKRLLLSNNFLWPRGMARRTHVGTCSSFEIFVGFFLAK